MYYRERGRAISQVGDLYSRGRWLKAKYSSICKCGNTIKPGDDLWYVPYQKRSFCYQCGASNYSDDLKALLSDKKP